MSNQLEEMPRRFEAILSDVDAAIEACECFEGEVLVKPDMKSGVRCQDCDFWMSRYDFESLFVTILNYV